LVRDSAAAAPPRHCGRLAVLLRAHAAPVSAERREEVTMQAGSAFR